MKKIRFFFENFPNFGSGTYRAPSKSPMFISGAYTPLYFLLNNIEKIKNNYLKLKKMLRYEPKAESFYEASYAYDKKRYNGGKGYDGPRYKPEFEKTIVFIVIFL